MRSREAALSASDALDLLVTPSLARRSLRRELSLGAVCGEATGERRGVVIRTAGVSATSRMSCSRYVAKARSQAWGEARLVGSARVETSAAVVRAPMQKFLFR